MLTARGVDTVGAEAPAEPPPPDLPPLPWCCPVGGSASKLPMVMAPDPSWSARLDRATAHNVAPHPPRRLVNPRALAYAAGQALLWPLLWLLLLLLLFLLWLLLLLS